MLKESREEWATGVVQLRDTDEGMSLLEKARFFEARK